MMGREHVRNIALVKGASVTAISDPDVGSRNESARAIQAVFGKAPAIYRNHRELLEKGAVDAVVIASPNDTHKAVLKDIFEARPDLPVLVEKPVCTSAKRRGLAARCGRETWRADLGGDGISLHAARPGADEGDRQKGRVGALQMLAIREHRFPFLEKVGDWNRFSRRTGGTLVEKCCHFFDLMRLIMADEPIRVFASGAMDVNHRDETYDGQTPDILDNAYVIVDFPLGSAGDAGSLHVRRGRLLAGDDRGDGRQGPRRDLHSGSRPILAGRRGASFRDRTVAAQAQGAEAARGRGRPHGSSRRATITAPPTTSISASIAPSPRALPVEVTLEDGLKAVMIGLAAEKVREDGQGRAAGVLRAGG